MYTPFKRMEHNYTYDPLFLEKKENLINFINHFPLNKQKYYSDPPETTHISRLRTFFANHLTECANSLSLKKIKTIFRLNKTKDTFFDSEHLHIAVHIRRRNPHDGGLPIGDASDATYLQIINHLRALYSDDNPLFHIYSQGNLSHFKSIYSAEDVSFHLNSPIEETFSSMVFADVLVTSASTFSYTAALLSDGHIYYTPFSSPPLPNWITL